MKKQKEQLAEFEDFVKNSKTLDFNEKDADFVEVRNFLITSHIKLLDQLIEKAEGEMKDEKNYLDPRNVTQHNQAVKTHINTLNKLKAEYELLEN